MFMEAGLNAIKLAHTYTSLHNMYSTCMYTGLSFQKKISECVLESGLVIGSGSSSYYADNMTLFQRKFAKSYCLERQPAPCIVN